MRVVLSLFAGFAFGFIGWLFAWLLIPYLDFTGLALPIAGATVLAFATSITAVSAFWDPYRSPRLKAIFVACVIGAAVVACVITFSITINNPKFTYVSRGVIFPMINFGVFSATLVAAGFYLYQELIQKDVYRNR